MVFLVRRKFPKPIHWLNFVKDTKLGQALYVSLVWRLSFVNSEAVYESINIKFPYILVLLMDWVMNKLS